MRTSPFWAGPSCSAMTDPRMWYFADPERGFSFAFTHNRLTAPPADNAALVAARVREALDLAT